MNNINYNQNYNIYNKKTVFFILIILIIIKIIIFISQ